MSYVQPVLPLVIVAFAVGLLARRVRGARRAERPALWAAFLLLLLWSSPPAAKLFYFTLERGHTAADLPTGEADAIVVFGGGVNKPYPTQPQALAAESTYRRAMHAAWLYHNWRRLPVFVSGGPVEGPGDITIADTARAVLDAAGVPAEEIFAERRSTSTLENGVRTAELLRARGISRVALVTDGYHMPRAEACLRKQGVDVVPAPCSLRSIRPFTHWRQFLPSGDAISDSEACLHEWVALAWYRLSGKI